MLEPQYVRVAEFLRRSRQEQALVGMRGVPFRPQVLSVRDCRGVVARGPSQRDFVHPWVLYPVKPPTLVLAVPRCVGAVA